MLYINLQTRGIIWIYALHKWSAFSNGATRQTALVFSLITEIVYLDDFCPLAMSTMYPCLISLHEAPWSRAAVWISSLYYESGFTLVPFLQPHQICTQRVYFYWYYKKETSVNTELYLRNLCNQIFVAITNPFLRKYEYNTEWTEMSVRTCFWECFDSLNSAKQTWYYSIWSETERTDILSNLF